MQFPCRNQLAAAACFMTPIHCTMSQIGIMLDMYDLLVRQQFVLSHLTETISTTIPHYECFTCPYSQAQAWWTNTALPLHIFCNFKWWSTKILFNCIDCPNIYVDVWWLVAVALLHSHIWQWGGKQLNASTWQNSHRSGVQIAIQLQLSCCSNKYVHMTVLPLKVLSRGQLVKQGSNTSATVFLLIVRLNCTATLEEILLLLWVRIRVTAKSGRITLLNSILQYQKYGQGRGAHLTDQWWWCQKLF